MKKLLVVVSLWAVPCFGQTAQPPKPGAEQQALQESFVGNWTCEATGDTGKITIAETCGMTANGFFLECHAKGPLGEVVNIRGYRPDEQAYVWFRYWNTGWSAFAKGWNRGNTWAFVFENESENGKAIRSQYTMTESAPDSYTFKSEESVQGEPWKLVQEGKCRRAK